MPTLSPLMAFTVALATGILSGCGVGGGTLLILILVFFADAAQSTAQAINLCYFLPAAGAALCFHAKNGRIDRAVFWPAVLAGISTAALAAWLAPRMDVTWMRRLFGGVILLVAVREVFAKNPQREKSK